MDYPMTPDKFAAVRAQLLANPDVTVSETTNTSGTIKTKDVLLGYAWDGTNLAISIIKRFTVLAKVASQFQIFAHVQTDLMQVA